MTEERIGSGGPLSAKAMRALLSASESGMLLGGQAQRTTRGTLLRRRGGARRSSASAVRSMAFSIASIDHTALTVTVRGGPVMGFATNVTASDTTVSVGGTVSEPHYVYAYGTVNPLSCNVATASTSTFPNHVQGQWRRPLFKCYVLNGAITIPAGGVYHEGLIDLRTFYGP